MTYSYWTNFLWYLTGVYKSTLAKILYLIFSFLNAWFLWYPVDKSWSEKIIVLVLENAWVKIFRNGFLFVSAFQRCIPPFGAPCSDRHHLFGECLASDVTQHGGPKLPKRQTHQKTAALKETAFKTAVLCALGNDIDSRWNGDTRPLDKGEVLDCCVPVIPYPFTKLRGTLNTPNHLPKGYPNALVWSYLIMVSRAAPRSGMLLGHDFALDGLSTLLPSFL